MGTAESPSKLRKWPAIAIFPAALAAAAVLAPVYAVVSLYIPRSWHVLNPVFVVCYGIFVGFCANKFHRAAPAFKLFKAAFLALAGAWVGFAVSWACWIGLFSEFGLSSPGFSAVFGFAFDPRGWIGFLTHPGTALDVLVRENCLLYVWRLRAFGVCDSYVFPIASWAIEFVLFTLGVFGRTTYSDW
ncbi:MAG: hypothetical protein LBT40_10750 [Deltaproteobacteria bacterium]|jgi:hypothetical protein|nr:hypothetical protein [Deltaproteobacteria bacterium]